MHRYKMGLFQEVTDVLVDYMGHVWGARNKEYRVTIAWIVVFEKGYMAIFGLVFYLNYSDIAQGYLLTIGAEGLFIIGTIYY